MSAELEVISGAEGTRGDQGGRGDERCSGRAGCKLAVGT